ncbi:alpha/beta fold hydrolase [Shewanella sp.]|uniref:alpha/beta fold hydrolase n=2 Tax=Shewanella sp. TaxID=50422 RepID=UPI0040543306
MMKKISAILFVVMVFAFWVIPSGQLFQLGVSTERYLAGLTLKTVHISDGEIAYLEGGTGDTLVLLHGFGANKDNWNRLAMHLSSDFHIIAVDLPGFGDSVKNINLDHDVAAQVSRVNEFVNALNLTQFHLGGNSMGGYVAGNYAAAFSDKIISLWLINTLGVASAPNSEMFEMIVQQQRPVILAKTKAEYDELISYVFYQAPFMPNFFIIELAKQAAKDFSLHSKIFQDIHHLADEKINFTAPLDKTLARLPVPVLMTWGDKDRVLHPDGAKRLAEVIPRSKVDIMENVGHLPMIEQPAATAELFLLFNKELESKAWVPPLTDLHPSPL